MGLIVLHEGDDPYEAASDFCQRYGLPGDIIQPLASHIVENMERASDAGGDGANSEPASARNAAMEEHCLPSDPPQQQQQQQAYPPSPAKQHAWQQQAGDDMASTLQRKLQLQQEQERRAARRSHSQPHESPLAKTVRGSEAAPEEEGGVPAYRPASVNSGYGSPYHGARPAGSPRGGGRIASGRQPQLHQPQALGKCTIGGGSVHDRLYSDHFRKQARLEEERRLKELEAQLKAEQVHVTAVSQALASHRIKGTYANYGERLYVEGRIDAMKKEREAQHSKEVEAATELEGATFHPRISKLARALKEQERGGVGAGAAPAGPAFQRLYYHSKPAKRQERMEVIRREQAEAEVAECTFRPAVCGRSARLVAARQQILRDSGIAPHEQLYNDSLRRQLKQQHLAAQPPEDATFAPRINRSSVVLRRLGEGRGGAGGDGGVGADRAGDEDAADDVAARLLERGRRYQERLAAAQEALAHPVDPATGRPLFQPETCRPPRFQRKPEGVPVGDHLYQISSEWEERAHAARAATEHRAAADAASTYVNQRSERLVAKLKHERFHAIFGYLQRGQPRRTVQLLELVGDGEFMDTIDPEVRTDIEYAARILARAVQRRSAGGDALADSASSAAPGGGVPDGVGADNYGSGPGAPRLAAVCAESRAGEVDLAGFVVLMEEVLERSKGISRQYLLPMPTSERRKFEEPSFRPAIDRNSQASAGRRQGILATRRRPEHLPAHELLYEEAKEIAAKKEAARSALEAKRLAECRFHPQLTAAPLAHEGRALKLAGSAPPSKRASTSGEDAAATGSASAGDGTSVEASPVKRGAQGSQQVYIAALERQINDALVRLSLTGEQVAAHLAAGGGGGPAAEQEPQPEQVGEHGGGVNLRASLDYRALFGSPSPVELEALQGGGVPSSLGGGHEVAGAEAEGELAGRETTLQWVSSSEHVVANVVGEGSAELLAGLDLAALAAVDVSGVAAPGDEEVRLWDAPDPLHNAVEEGDAVLVRELLEKKTPEAGDVNPDDILAAYVAAAADDRPDPNERDETHCTPLHVALLHGHLEVMQALLEADPPARLNKTCEGSPPLHMAVCAGALPHRHEFAPAAVALLLRHGAVPYERDDTGRTALHWAACLGLTDVAEALIASGRHHAAADLERQQQQYEQQLATLAAAEKEAAAAAEAVAAAAQAAGAAPPPEPLAHKRRWPAPPAPLPALADFQDKQGNTSLHLAARYRHPGMVGLLLAQAGTGEGAAAAAEAASRNKNKAGHTPLHLAALGGSAASCAALLRVAPAAGDLATRQGLTPAAVAAKRGHAALAAALQAGAAATAALAEQETAAAEAPRTLLLAPPECLNHHTCPPIVRGGPDHPPENVDRLMVLTKPQASPSRGLLSFIFWACDVRIVYGTSPLAPARLSPAQRNAPRTSRSRASPPQWGILRTAEFERALRWDESSKRAQLGDILRVHDWPYVRRIQAICERLPDDPSVIGHIDGDTAISRGSFTAALAAAGATWMRWWRASAACATPFARQGFCLLSNVAIAAAYALTVHRLAGVRRVAIIDFDVHHGNGTEACVANTVPSIARHAFSTPFSEGSQLFPQWKPWLGEEDAQRIFFASVQGYGPKLPGVEAFVYPGTGATCDTRALRSKKEEEEAAAAAATAAAAAAAAAGDGPAKMETDLAPTPTRTTSLTGPASPRTTSLTGPASPRAASLAGAGSPRAAAVAANGETGVEEDPDHEFDYTGGDVPTLEGPRIIDVGIPGPGSKVGLWRRAWRDKILPALANFEPDLIFVSAGFDAHKKDEINFHYIGVTERDYEWLTDQLVQVANRCCNGRIVSVLEGGYRIQGALVSAFARSVAAHVRALAEPNNQVWDPQEARWERQHEKQLKAEAEAKKAAALAADLARRAAADAARASALTAAAGGGGGAAAAAEAADAVVAAAAVGSPRADADEVEEGGGRSKRRRAAVDYQALAAKLDAEAAAAQRAASGAGGGTS
eukprot:scaffold10.g2366.t1